MSHLRKCPPQRSATFVLCIALIFLFLRNSDVCLSEMKRGLSLCAGVLVPTLFPYMIISEMLVRADLGYYLGKFLEKPMRRLFGIGGSGAGALALGIICGFPVGAKTAASLYSRGELTKKELEKLLTFCNYPSAPFVIFAVGKKLLGNAALGIFLYSVNVITGLFFGAITKSKRHIGSTQNTRLLMNAHQPFFKIFTDSVSSAAGAVISVCALVTFFTCAVGCISAIECINGAPLLKAIIFSFFELTSGAAACAALMSRSLSAILTAAAVGWSGVSVLMQIYSSCTVESDAPSLLPYIGSRVFSSAICAVSTAASIRFFPTLLPGNIPDTDVFLEFSAYPTAFTYAVNFLFLVSVLFYSNKKLDRRRMI